MAVDDHGLEVLKKSGEEITPGDKSNYYIQTKMLDSSGNTIDLETNDSGQLKVVLDGKVCENNSTSTPLSAAGVFNGTAGETLDYAMIFITVFSDVESATDGLMTEVSSDNITWRDGDAFTIPANTEKTFSFQPNKKYFRVNYTNGGSDQTVFDLHTIFKKTNSKPSSHRIQDAIVDEDDATLQKSVITGKSPSGSFINASVTNGGNFKVSLEELESGVSVNSNSQLKATLFDSSGNEFNSISDASANKHLGVGVIQNIITSSKNITSTNLASGATFTGAADETFGINGIQVLHSADQDCTVYIDQSIDDTFADSTQTIVDSFECLANEACSRTFISVAPYYRLRVTNTGISSTTKILTATGMTPFINPLPRSLTDDDRLKSESTLTGRENTDRHVWVAPTNALKVQEDYRLVGTNFDGTTKDPNFWTETVTGSGSVSQLGGEIELKTGTTANSTAIYDSVRRARFVVGSALHWQAIIKFVTAGTTDNIRRVGAFDDDNGFYLELDGTTFSIGFRKATVDTIVSSGSFNGNYGPNYIMNQAYHKLGIEWTPRGIFFYIDGQLLHKDGVGHRSNFLSLPIRIENLNDNGNTTDVTLDCLATTISRLGPLQTNSTYKFLGSNATTVCKYGPGILHNIVNLDNAGDVAVYDNTAGSGTQMAVIDTAKALGTLNFDAPFSNGLTIVVTGGAKVTVIYE